MPYDEQPSHDAVDMPGCLSLIATSAGVLFVALALIVAQFPTLEMALIQETRTVAGWPFHFYCRTTKGTDESYHQMTPFGIAYSGPRWSYATSSDLDYLFLMNDIAVCSLLIVGTGVGMSRLFLAANHPGQF